MSRVQRDLDADEGVAADESIGKRRESFLRSIGRGGHEGRDCGARQRLRQGVVRSQWKLSTDTQEPPVTF